MELTNEARQWLIAWARRSIAGALAREDEASPGELPPGTELPRGCFVSLHRRDGSLRGCIGTFSADESLWKNVREMAVAAATRDPRFSQISPEELEGCLLEISVLSPRREAEASEVEVGKHGINVTMGTRRGVLLPQVAVAQNWDREAFLDHTCIKAGLPGDAWRGGSVTIELFTADVFEEER